MPETSSPSPTDPPTSWDKATRQEFQQLVRLTGSRTRALQLHRTTEPNPEKGLDRLLSPSDFPTFQETEEQLQENFDEGRARDIAQLTLVLQHAGLEEDREHDKLFEGFSERERQLKTRKKREQEALTNLQPGHADLDPADLQHELQIINLQLDDLYRQAQLCLEIQAMRQEYDQLTQGQEALSNENILDAVAHRGETRLEEIQEALQNQQPLAQLAAVERAAEQATAAGRRTHRAGATERQATDPSHNRSGRGR